MAKKTPEDFVKTYRPIAEQVGKEIGVDPNIILSQWALESRWGNAVPGSHNIAGIKDFSGSGKPAKDNKLGTVAKYAEFEDPQTFGLYYSDMIQRNFPNAVGSGNDIGAFTRGLVSGKRGAYFEADPQNYAVGLTAIHNSIPGVQPADRPDLSKPAEPRAETDEERDARVQRDMDEQERRQAQLYGGAAGAGVSIARGIGSAAGSAVESGTERVVRGIQAASTPATPTTPAATPTGPAATSTGPAAATRGSAAPSGPRIPAPPGTMMGGSGTFNYGKAFGLTDIEAARALDMSKQTGGASDLISQRREVMNRLPKMFPSESWVENPNYGGLMTLEGREPKGSFRVQGPTPDMPPSTLLGPAAPPPQGTLVQLPPRQVVPTTPPPPSIGQRVVGGLETVADMFKSMMKPVGGAAAATGRVVVPPLALASAAGEGANILQQARKPNAERDYTGATLSGLNILGGGLSLFPATAPVGIPLSIGTAAAQAYRDDPEILEKLRKRIFSGDYPVDIVAP